MSGSSASPAPLERDEIIETGKERFFRDLGGGGEVEVFFAPGRVNLIGEHLDYNGGPVLPAAISTGIFAFARPRDDGLLRLRSSSFDEEGLIDPAAVAARTGGARWYDYPAGVVARFMAEGSGPPRGRDVLYVSTMPDGAGLSSSAALEVLTACVLYPGSVASPEARLRTALLCQKAENEYVGVQCGVMDQFAVAMGKKGHAMLLDTGTLASEHVPLRLEDCALVIMNSNRPRKLSDSKYNERRGECEEALARIRAARPGVTALAGAALEDLDCVPDGPLRRRARHVITETARVRESVKLLRADDLETFGTLMVESHRSLQRDYEVTGAELDALVGAALEVEGCMGARMTGAGFGGCAVALVRREALEDFFGTVTSRYEDATGLPAGLFIVTAADGAGPVQ